MAADLRQLGPLTTGEGRLRTPLLIAEVEHGSSDGTWWLQNLGAGVDLNPFALDLLELEREARDELVAVVEASVEAEEAATSAARSHAILRALQEESIDGLDGLDPTALSSTPVGKGIHNAGVVMTTAGSACSICSLVEDLDELANYPELLSEGPAAILLGQAPVPEVPLPAPHPTIARSSLRQDKTVHSAMVNDFIVVTGPPGTGKSQVLVNVVAAAVAKGETVLFASKNNLHPQRPDLQSLKCRSRRRAQAWSTIEKSLLQVYGILHERSRLDAEFEDREAMLKATTGSTSRSNKMACALTSNATVPRLTPITRRMLPGPRRPVRRLDGDVLQRAGT